MKPKIAKIVVGLPVEGPFDYQIGTDLQDRIAVGQRVRVSFNRRDRLGFVVGTAQRSLFKRLNPILSLLDNGPALDEPTFELARAISAHYGCSLGEAIETCLPPVLRRDKVSISSALLSTAAKGTAVEGNKMVLVHDQTRHKRWPFIIENIQKVIDQKKSAIVLIPEIAFIDETVLILRKTLTCPIAVLDKKLAPKKELAQWEEMRKGEYSIVVGVRSAVFAPLPNLGLIIVDEEENEAYKQEQTPHYRASEIAEMRSKIEQCRVLFASSVFTAEIWEKAKRNKWEKVIFDAEENGQVQIVDMSNYNPGKTSILSFPLQNAMQKTLEKGGKVLLFMNRRGFSTRTYCQQCGFTVKCKRCNVNLSYLFSEKTMICRYCNFKRELPKVCPQCNGSYLRSTGIGVEKLESDVARIYPGAQIRRYDSGNKVFIQNADIIIATGAVFREHKQWAVSLVALLNFDDQMHHYDFRCGQKAFSLLIHLKQLANEKLFIQTRMGGNYCLKAVQTMDFSKFYREELKLRKELNLPPYRNLVALGLRGKKENIVFEQCSDLFERLKKKNPKGIDISDPHPDAKPKLRDQYRYTILLKGRSVKSILALIKSALKEFKKRNIVITVNVDP
ncbi:MAG: primosomal protein N' [Candidatus Omnitrophica bacterium]|nr:primosomal protein N' [Candidatus Omnitrophota bacterium]